MGCTGGRLPASVGWSIGLVGATPAEFESADESVFDFRDDMAVGLHESILEVVTEPSSLRDFWNVVGDEPRLMTVSESVESQARPNRGDILRGLPSTAGRNTRRSKVLRRKG